MGQEKLLNNHYLKFSLFSYSPKDYTGRRMHQEPSFKQLSQDTKINISSIGLQVLNYLYYIDDCLGVLSKEPGLLLSGLRSVSKSGGSIQKQKLYHH